MQRYLIIMEPTPMGYSAYSPDVPGCIATGPSTEAVQVNMGEAITFHFDELRADGHPLPPPQSIATYVEVAA